MALTKRVCGPRRVVLCYELPGNVIVRDPALAEDMDPKAYLDSLFDPSLVKLKNGEQPSWLTIQGPTRRQRELAGDTPGERANWYIRCGTKAVENYLRVDDAGNSTPVTVTLNSDGVATEQLLDDLDLDDFSKYAWFGMIRDLSQAGAGPLAKPSVKPAGPTE